MMDSQSQPQMHEYIIRLLALLSRITLFMPTNQALRNATRTSPDCKRCVEDHATHKEGSYKTATVELACRCLFIQYWKSSIRLTTLLGLSEDSLIYALFLPAKIAKQVGK